MIEIENDKVRLERVSYTYEYSPDNLRDFICYVEKSRPDGCFDRQRVVSNEFRERFAKSIAELIIADWEHLVFDEEIAQRKNGNVVCSACMYIVKKKKEK